MSTTLKRAEMLCPVTMCTVPLLMVIYSNDAVEVRYADQSCLQVAPCGSTFVHHESPSETFHPAHGMKSIHQRCQFVTSDYKYKVLQALDFRNRFAERPFVCKDLITEDQIVPLYATVQDVAWPRSLEEANYEFLPDGGVRLISVDEFASLVLSPHRQDFTVCYLSRVSEEPSKLKTKVCRRDRRKERSDGKEIRTKTGVDGKGLTNTNENAKSSHCQTNLEDDKSRGRTGSCMNTGNVVVGQHGMKVGDVKDSAAFHNIKKSPGSVKSAGSDSEDPLCRKLRDELTMSPISVASGMRSCHSSPGEGREEKEYNRYSTPTQTDAVKTNMEDAVEVGGKRSAFKYYKRQEVDDGQNGSFLETLDNKNGTSGKKCDSANTTLVPETRAVAEVGSHEEFSRKIYDQETHIRSSSDHKATRATTVDKFSIRSDESESGESEIIEADEDARCRCLYSWITRHFSSDECPVAWSHAISLARAVMDNRQELEEKALKQPFIPQKSKFDSKKLSEKERKLLNLSTLPLPLPLSCPSQHLHKQLTKYVYDTDKDALENLTTFKQGKLKVLMAEGIIFRLLRLNSTKSIEIFPGDGTVLLSQGVKGHYYRHIIPVGNTGELEERTYSLKSLPPKTPGATYSIEKLIRRANRFMTQAVQEEKTLTGSDICCWKHQLAIVEPLPTTILEECTVPGYGRFSAFSSGHVRILFEDRTALDMDCDFSARIEGCLQHSDGTGHMVSSEQTMPGAMKVNPESRLGFCKLLLPNGQYQIVDVRKPGLYRKYTDSALEWASWVNSSPTKRKDFYREREQQISHEQMIAKELQKIKCFSYIMDSAIPSSTKPVQEEHTTVDNLHTTTKGDTFNERHDCRFSTHSQTHLSNQQSSYMDHSSTLQHQMYGTHGLHKDFSHLSSVSMQSRNSGASHFTNPEILLGFNNVRQALLKTSKVLSDIDDILEKKKS